MVSMGELIRVILMNTLLSVVSNVLTVRRQGSCQELVGGPRRVYRENKYLHDTSRIYVQPHRSHYFCVYTIGHLALTATLTIRFPGQISILESLALMSSTFSDTLYFHIRWKHQSSGDSNKYGKALVSFLFGWCQDRMIVGMQ